MCRSCWPARRLPATARDRYRSVRRRSTQPGRTSATADRARCRRSWRWCRVHEATDIRVLHVFRAWWRQIAQLERRLQRRQRLRSVQLRLEVAREHIPAETAGDRQKTGGRRIARSATNRVAVDATCATRDLLGGGDDLVPGVGSGADEVVAPGEDLHVTQPW